MGVPERKEMKRHRRHNLKERFEILKTLGQGTYGKVKLSVEKASGVQYAIKSIRKKRIETEQDLVRVRREIEIMATLHHPHIVTVHEVFENKERIVLVMDYASGGELYDFINERKGLYEDQARKFFRQIVSAVYYLHMNGIVHRDLKLENILLDGFGNVQIADFGLSNVYGADKLLNTFCGSPLYASPEIVNGNPYYGPEVDCWSLGVVLYTLVYGAMPFDGSDFKRLKQQITEGDYFEPKNPSDASGLIKQLLCPNASKRATVEDICVHWWVNFGFDKNPAELAELSSSTVDRNSLVKTLKSGYASDSDYENVDVKSHGNKKQTSRPLKGILKKPRDADSLSCSEEPVADEVIQLPQVNGFSNRENDRLKKPRSNCELNNDWLGYLATDVNDVLSSGTNSVENRRSAPVSCENTKAVFDSSKKPKKSILKNKSGNSRSDSGCIIDEQMNIYAALEKFQVEYPFREKENDEKVNRAENQRDSAYIERKQSCESSEPHDSNIYDLNDIESVLDDIVNFKVATEKRLANSSALDVTDDIFSNVSQNQSPPTIMIPLKDYSDYDPTKEPVRYRNKSHKPLKSILKRNSRSKENSWRYSLGSQGSNSSGDILDFSYDSADGESFMQDYCAVPIPLTDEEEIQSNGMLHLDSRRPAVEKSFVESLQKPWSNFDVLEWQDVDAPLNDSLTRAKVGGEEETMGEFKETDILDDLAISDENAEGEDCAMTDLKLHELNGEIDGPVKEDLEMVGVVYNRQHVDNSHHGTVSERPPPLPERPPPIGAPASPVKSHTTPPPTPPPPLPETPPPPFKTFELDVFDIDMYTLDEFATSSSKNEVILNGGSEGMSNENLQTLDYDKVFDAIEEQNKEALDSLSLPNSPDKPDTAALDKNILAQMQGYFQNEEPLLHHFYGRGKSKSRSAQAIPETEKLCRSPQSNTLSKELHDTLDFYNLELRRSFENIKLHISEDDLVQFYKVEASDIELKNEPSCSTSGTDEARQNSVHTSVLHIDSEGTEGTESLVQQSSKEDMTRLGIELVDLFIEEDTMQHNLSELAQDNTYSEFHQISSDESGGESSILGGKSPWSSLMQTGELHSCDNAGRNNVHCVQLIDLSTDQSSSDLSDVGEIRQTGAGHNCQKIPCDLHINEDILLSAIPLNLDGLQSLPPNGLDLSLHHPSLDILQCNDSDKLLSNSREDLAKVPDVMKQSTHYLDEIMETIDKLGEQLDSELKSCDSNNTATTNCTSDFLIDFDEASDVYSQAMAIPDRLVENL